MLQHRGNCRAGTASGFGYSLACRLDQMGFTVFAGCRNPDDSRAQNLRRACSNRLQLVKVDVNSDADVQDAYECVKRKLGQKCTCNGN